MGSADRPPELFYFEPLRFNEVANCFDRRKAELRANEPQIIFDQWIRRYCKRAILFYNSQIARFQASVESGFRRAHRLEDDDSIYDLGFEVEWEEWTSKVNLDDCIEHTEFKIQALADLAASLRTNDQSQRDSAFASLDEILARPINFVDAAQASRIYQDLDELWFNKTIESTPQSKQQLQTLPYEQYLKSPHWRKVRAAMILINRAVCQSQPCHAAGESWYGEDNESSLHVHHLNYTNIGCERFADLKLLCNKHHEGLHRNCA